MPTITDDALAERIDPYLAVDRALNAAERGVFMERILVGQHDGAHVADWLSAADDSDYRCGDLEKWWKIGGQKALDYLLVLHELPERLTRKLITVAWYASFAIGDAEIEPRRRGLVEIASGAALWARGYGEALGWYPTDPAEETTSEPG